MFKIYWLKNVIYLFENEENFGFSLAYFNPHHPNPQLNFCVEPINLQLTSESLINVMPHKDDNFALIELKINLCLSALPAMNDCIQHKCTDFFLKNRIKEFTEYLSYLHFWQTRLSDPLMRWPIKQKTSLLEKINSLPESQRYLLNTLEIIENLQQYLTDQITSTETINVIKAALRSYLIENGVYFSILPEQVYPRLFDIFFTKNLTANLQAICAQLPWDRLFFDNTRPPAQIKFFETLELFSYMCEYLSLLDVLALSETSKYIRYMVKGYLNYTKSYIAFYNRPIGGKVSISQLVGNTIIPYPIFFSIADAGDIKQFFNLLCYFPRKFEKLEDRYGDILDLFLMRYIKNNMIYSQQGTTLPAQELFTQIKYRLDEQFYQLIKESRDKNPDWNIYFNVTESRYGNTTSPSLLALYRFVAYFRLFEHNKAYQTPLYRLNTCLFYSDTIMRRQHLIPITLLVRNSYKIPDIKNYEDCLLAAMKEYKNSSMTFHPLFVAAFYNRIEIVRYLLSLMTLDLTEFSPNKFGYNKRKIIFTFILLKFCETIAHRPTWYDDFFNNNEKTLRQIFIPLEIEIMLSELDCPKILLSYGYKAAESESLDNENSLTRIFFNNCNKTFKQNLIEKLPKDLLMSETIKEFLEFPEESELLSPPQNKRLREETFTLFASTRDTQIITIDTTTNTWGKSCKKRR